MSRQFRPVGAVIQPQFPRISANMAGVAAVFALHCGAGLFILM
jgi:hypothetical protein